MQCLQLYDMFEAQLLRADAQLALACQDNLCQGAGARFAAKCCMGRERNGLPGKAVQTNANQTDAKLALIAIVADFRC